MRIEEDSVNKYIKIDSVCSVVKRLLGVNKIQTSMFSLYSMEEY